MIKSGEYIQLLMWFEKSYNANFLMDYARYEQIEPIEACKRMDELRLLHNKYKKECETYDIYPHLDLTKMNLYIEDLHDVCRQFKIRIEFNSKGNQEYKSGIHANYYHENRKITDLIVLYQNRKPSHVSR